MDKNRPKTYKAIAHRITALVMSVWLIFMLLLTWAVAKDFQNQIYSAAGQMAWYSNHTRYGTPHSEELPGYSDMIRILRLGEAYQIIRAEPLLPIVREHRLGLNSDHPLWGKWNLAYGFQPTVIYYDKNDQVMLKSGNILSFTYCTEEAWLAREPQVTGIGYTDLDALGAGGKEALDYLWGFPTADSPSSFYMFDSVLRLKGYFEGSRFIPVSVDKAKYTLYYGEDYYNMLSRYDHNGALDWENTYTAEAPGGVELTTVYSWEVGGYDYEHLPVTVGGRRFDSLVELLEVSIADDYIYGYDRESLFDSIAIFSGKIEDDPEVGRYALAIRCWPVQYALLRLIPTYLVSFALVAAALWLILRAIKRNVTATLEMLVHRLTNDAPIEHLSNWQEPHDLEVLLKEGQAQRRALVNDNQQLQKSLEYARNAEENRRQLVSNITHELKTPLAIIHSYAEGLQSGIAREKQEKYLATILEEAERMDGMVLEMLDFSRLESGKVKLSADHFSLYQLTQGIVEKLTPAAQARNLTISWSFFNDCFLTADESRLAQVVTNLVSNAIRYTPEGGTIWLRVFSDEKEAVFQIENTGEHLPQAVLEKIFESFYRAEDSRTNKGTGLGLPIAKSIVELHRGKLTARNTRVNGAACIEFDFRIPLK